MKPISVEGPTVDYQERDRMGYKENLVNDLDKIASTYDSARLNSDPTVVESLTLNLVNYLEEKGHSERDKSVTNSNVYPVRVLQAIRDGKGKIYGLGFGIEISTKEEGEEPTLRFQMLRGDAKRIEKLEHGNYSTLTPTLYHLVETGTSPILSRSKESLICSAQVLCSDIFRNMGIEDSVKVEVMEGILNKIAEVKEE